jgi:HSP20 family molecular chaperone IbpA
MKNTSNLKVPSIYSLLNRDIFYTSDILPVNIENLKDQDGKETGYKVVVNTDGINDNTLNVSVIPSSHGDYPILHLELAESTEQVDEDKNSSYYRREFKSHTFTKNVMLPEDIDYGSISEMEKKDNNEIVFTVNKNKLKKPPETIKLKLKQ